MPQALMEINYRPVSIRERQVMPAESHLLTQFLVYTLDCTQCISRIHLGNTLDRCPERYVTPPAGIYVFRPQRPVTVTASQQLVQGKLLVLRHSRH